jgi:RNA polymerase sigma factor (sigma-70 family)
MKDAAAPNRAIDPEDALLQCARQLPRTPTASDEAVLGQYEAGVRRYCRSRTHSREDAEDAAQDTYIRYLRRSDRHVRNPEAWLITAAARACLDLNRRRQYEARFMAPPPAMTAKGDLVTEGRVADPHAADPERLVVEAVWISRLLRQLSERDRTIITDLYLMGSSLAQVATFLGISYDSAKMSAMRARRHVRAILTRQPATSR